MASQMVICKSCGNWNPNYAVYCSHCGRRPSKPKLTNRRLNWKLLIACGVLFQLLVFSEAQSENENGISELSVRANSSEPASLPLALDLLKKILKNGTNRNRRYCVYCKASMTAPVDSHKENCVWRRAWELVSEQKP